MAKESEEGRKLKEEIKASVQKETEKVDKRLREAIERRRQEENEKKLFGLF